MTHGPYIASAAAPAWRQPCNCEAYTFPHRPLSGKCRAALDWEALAVREPGQSEREDFNSREATVDNEPAFPATDAAGAAWPGMMLRDYFAAAALPILGQILAIDAHERTTPDGSPLTEKSFARQAYAIADAMLAERDK